MKVLDIIVIIVLVLLLSVFVVYAFHAQTPLQQEVKAYHDTGEGELPFSEAGNSHMKDVQLLLFWLRIITAALLLYFIFRLTYIQPESYLISGLVLGALMLVAIALPYRTVDTLMHSVLFPQGNWMFYINTLMAQTYPTQYWIQQATRWAALVVVSSVGLAVFGRINSKK